MICPTCNAWTRTLETREKPGHTTYRRYECANLHRFHTTESVVIVPVPVTRADRVRNLMRNDYLGGMTASHLAVCLNVSVRVVVDVLSKMRDAYIKSWVVERGRWVRVWTVAKDAHSAPYHCPRPTMKPPKVNK